MAELYTNLARSTLASGITAIDTALTVATGDGNDLFPAVGVGDFFRCLLFKKSTGDVEIIKVTARAGDLFTITRAQEKIGNIAATAIAFDAGDLIELRPTAGFFDSIGPISTYDIQSSAYNYALDQGVKNAVVIQLFPIPASYFSPGRFMFLTRFNNNGPTTLNINGVAGGPKNIKRLDGNVLSEDDIIANTVADVVYDSIAGNFVLLNPRSKTLPGPWTIKGDLQINQSAYFDAVVNHGTVTAASETIDFGLGNKHYIELSPAIGNVIDLPFTPTPGPSDYRLMIKQDATGSRTVTWPANSKFIGGGAPVLSTDPNAVDIASIYYGGTNYYIALSYDWS